MKLHSPMSPETYLSAMKAHMGSHFAFGDDRFTGFFLGGLFSVTYHSGYEYDRRFNNPKNSALGYVRRMKDGCLVRFIRLKGILNPPSYLLVSTLLTLGLLLQNVYSIPLALALGFGVTAVLAPIGALLEGLISERSAEGGQILLSFLLDPTDPYANLNEIF